MLRPLCALFALAVLLSGCERPSERAARERAFAGRVLQGVLVFPRSTLTSVATADDAAEVELSTSASPDAVLTWYRDALRLNGWDIRSEAKESGDGTALYAQRGQRPLWIRIRPRDGGTRYSLVGAQVKGDTIE